MYTTLYGYRAPAFMPWRRWLQTVNKFRAAGLSKSAVTHTAVKMPSLSLRSNEHIRAFVCGEDHIGKVNMLATTQRLLIVEQNGNDVSSRTLIYPFIDGVHVSRSGHTAHVTIFTPFGDYRIQSDNLEEVERFAIYIERRCEPSHRQKEMWYDHNPQKRPV